MEPIIAKCGYRCDLCPAYAPNIKSEADKQRMCEAWARYFGSQLQPADITACAGCLQGDGDPDCDVRPCAEQKGLENCAHCELFACDKLKPRMNIVEDKVKDVANIPEDDYNVFIKPFAGKERLLEIRQRLSQR